MESDFYTKLYALSQRTKRLDLFDKIKEKFKDWFDNNISEYELTLELHESGDWRDTAWVGIKINTKKTYAELEALYEDFDKTFETGEIPRGLSINIDHWTEERGYTSFDIFEH